MSAGRMPRREAVSRSITREAANRVRSADFTLGQRLEIDLHAAGVERGVRSVNADERGEGVDRGVFQNDVGESTLAPSHGVKGDALRTLGNAEDDARVMDGEKALGNV